MATCQADPLNYNTRAFSTPSPRNMMIKRACESRIGRPPRTGHVERSDTTKQSPHQARRDRRSRPSTRRPGTRMTTSPLGRRPSRRSRLPLRAADVGRPAPEHRQARDSRSENVRANRRCPRPGRAQAAVRHAEELRRPGSDADRPASHLRRRGEARNWCSGRGLNYIRTHQATVDPRRRHRADCRRSCRTRRWRPVRG